MSSNTYQPLTPVEKMNTRLFFMKLFERSITFDSVSEEFLNLRDLTFLNANLSLYEQDVPFEKNFYNPTVQFTEKMSDSPNVNRYGKYGVYTRIESFIDSLFSSYDECLRAKTEHNTELSKWKNLNYFIRDLPTINL